MLLPRGFSLKPSIAWNVAKVTASFVISHVVRRPVVWGRPISIMMEPISRCNLQCPLCPIGARELKRDLGTMSLEHFQRLIDNVGPQVRVVALWNQGEPTINDKLPEMIRYAHGKGIYTMTSTNGNLPTPLSLKLFENPTIEVAPRLVGKILEAGQVSGRIVEVEAYTTDPASHACRRTERSAIMFDTWGHVYVYIIYGMYPCLNFTTEKGGVGAVLIRAVEPLRGLDIMRERRKVSDVHQLCSGPGKLCQAFGIGLEHNGTVIGDFVKLYNGKAGPIATSPRIGITKALDLHWRFFEEGNPFVSKGQKAKKPKSRNREI